MARTHTTRAVTRPGRFRRTWRGAKRQVRLTGRSFVEPFRAGRHHRRLLRLLTDRIADPRTTALAERALGAADAILADAPGSYAHSAAIGGTAVTVQVAGRGLPQPPLPWRTGSATSWQAPLDACAEADGDRVRLPVVVSAYEDGAMVLDLLRGPGLVTVEGEATPARALLQALAAQLELRPERTELVVARGVHPRYEGPDLSLVLDALERSTDDRGAPGHTTVVCVDPDEHQAPRIQRLAAAGRITFLVRGRVGGHRWTLRLDGEGRVTAPELGLHEECGPLPQAVARTVRRSAMTTGTRRPAGAPRTRADRSAARPTAPPPPSEPQRTAVPVQPRRSAATSRPAVTAPTDPPRSVATPAGVSAASGGRPAR